MKDKIYNLASILAVISFIGILSTFWTDVTVPAVFLLCTITSLLYLYPRKWFLSGIWAFNAFIWATYLIIM